MVIKYTNDDVVPVISFHSLPVATPQLCAELGDRSEPFPSSAEKKNLPYIPFFFQFTVNFPRIKISL